MAFAETLSEKGSPHSALAERSVLGSILLEPVNLHLAAELLQPDDFHLDPHRKIFRAMLELSHAAVAPDYITLGDVLTRRHELESCGGLEYLVSLTDGLPLGLSVESHARIVKDKAVQRRLMQVAGEINLACLDGGTSGGEILDRAQRDILAIAEDNVRDGLTPISDMAPGLLQTIDRMREGQEITGLATGYHQLDQLTAGLQRGELIVIAGRPSMGKTALAMNMVENMALRQGRAAAVFSLEMTKLQLVLRMLCSVAHVSAHKLRSGWAGKDDESRLTDATSQLSGCPIFIDDTSGIDLGSLRAKCRRLKYELDQRRPKQSLDLVVVDYLQLMGSRQRTENRNQEVSAISRGLKMLAKELEVPLIALSQLSRSPEQRRGDNRPMLSDLRESGAIEQDADLVAFIYRDEVYNKNSEDAGKAEIIIAKQRNGPTDTVKLAFLRDFTRFENLSEADE